MKVLVIGSGGREHALCRSFAKSPKVEKVYCAPGNGGTMLDAKNVNIGVSDFEALAAFAKAENIAFTFVGPEVPLAEGIVDFFEGKGLKIIGPSQKAAMLESSKIYSKEFMKKYAIPTAEFHKFYDIDSALGFLNSWEENKKAVVKADGLAAGKGVYMCSGRDEAKNAVKQMMNDKVLGEAGAAVIIEEHISGPELSYLIFTDGISYAVMPASQDHKRINDNDEGPNTGGMGAYAPAPLATESLNEKVENEIIKKVIEGIKAEKFNYKGVLYIGVIMNGENPSVLEFNCRFGDPETQALLPLLDTDLTDICLSVLDKKLSEMKRNIKWKKETAVCVVLSSGGYPGKFESGFEINGIENITDKDTIVFHAGTRLESGKFVNSGGRVLGITSTGSGINSAVDKVYSEVKKISFKNMHYRKDIAWRALDGK